LCLDQMLARFTTVGGLAIDGSGAGGLDGVAGLAGRPVRPVTDLTVDRALFHVARLRDGRARGRARTVLAFHDASLCAIATVFGAFAPITDLPNGGGGEIALLLRQQFTTRLSTTSGKLLDRADALLYATADRLSAFRPCLPFIVFTIPITLLSIAFDFVGQRRALATTMEGGLRDFARLNLNTTLTIERALGKVRPGAHGTVHWARLVAVTLFAQMGAVLAASHSGLGDGARAMTGEAVATTDARAPRTPLLDCTVTRANACCTCAFHDEVARSQMGKCDRHRQPKQCPWYGIALRHCTWQCSWTSRSTSH